MWCLLTAPTRSFEARRRTPAHSGGIRRVETDWADRQQARQRQTLRDIVVFYRLFRKQLLLMGIDPAAAVSPQAGDEAVAELAAIPDSLELLTADIAITRGDDGDCTEAQADFERLVAMLRDEPQLDLADASICDLMAYCVALTNMARGQSTS